MKDRVFNPYLPRWEYIPDGEPHAFSDRVYVYGSLSTVKLHRIFQCSTHTTVSGRNRKTPLESRSALPAPVPSFPFSVQNPTGNTAETLQ